MREEDVKEIFETKWQVWVHELTDTVQVLPQLHIPVVVERGLKSHFKTQQIYKELRERLKLKGIENAVYKELT